MAEIARKMIAAMDSGHDIFSDCTCEKCNRAKQEMLVQAIRVLAASGPAEGMERAGYERISEGMEAGRIVSPGEVFRVMLIACISEIKATDA